MYCVQFKTMKIAVEGCMHGDLDKVYDTIKYIENTRNIKIDLLLCCGDFQALDLKPNYGRAWANMGISYANQVCYILHRSLIVLTFMKRELQLLYPSKYFILPMKIK
ncbi:hypothetical protein ES332_A08G000300v1 [Gossypium tomentosum]|uniref:Calcineurin-like phosphoesterase domain-containing protein n=1 Tax=Gossypium tomentosum TaxID=34277 RepID=A0A5D2PCQ5_GOSTO|nr:hypothetical protein ES332_A08G000300v1 [Gossypium tomentosum]